MNDRGFVVDHLGLLNVAIVQAGKGLLGAKSLGSSDSGDHFFSEISAVSYMFERLSGVKL